jgi:hypothetical protein
VDAAPHTAQRGAGTGFSDSTDFLAMAKISGEMIGSAIGFFFISDSTIKQIVADGKKVQSDYAGLSASTE